MKQASVRFLASQDGQVLGADLYTQSAFDKLIKRAGAITDDMMREAHLLRFESHPAKIVIDVWADFFIRGIPLSLVSRADDCLAERQNPKTYIDKSGVPASVFCARLFILNPNSRSKENLGNELAHQLSLLLEDMVESTCKMNTLAAVVHQVIIVTCTLI